MLETVLTDPGYRLVRAESAEAGAARAGRRGIRPPRARHPDAGHERFRARPNDQAAARRPPGCRSSSSPPTTAKTSMCSKATAPGRWITCTSRSTRRSSGPRSPCSPSCTARAARAPGPTTPCSNEVTARRRAEEQLRQLNDELERRVAERTADCLLAAASARLRSLARQHAGHLDPVRPGVAVRVRELWPSRTRPGGRETSSSGAIDAATSGCRDDAL